MTTEDYDVKVVNKCACQDVYGCNSGLSLLSHQLVVLRQDLQSSAQTCMSRGDTASLQTLAVETELREVQQRTTELQKKGNCLINQVGNLLQKQNQFLKRASKVSAEDQKDGKVPSLKWELPGKENQSSYYNKLKEECTKEESKDEKTPKKDCLKSAPSEDTEDSDQKYLDLIDLLTVKMFQSDCDPEAAKKPKKCNSLPRCLDSVISKSSSQTCLATPSTASQPLSAYQRLFGVGGSPARPCSPGPSTASARRQKIFIPKHRARHSSPFLLIGVK